MNISQKELEDRIDIFKDKLKGSGIKLTHQRLEIYREVAKSANHPDAEAIFKGVRKRMPTVSLDTVYRTLWMLLDLDIISTLGTNHKKTRFDANMKAHHHFLCSNCGKTLDFYSKELDKLKIPSDAEITGDVQTIQVIVKGRCKQCQQKNN
jgi:Fur family peroxide stress response transcriptional regulator